MRQTFSVSELPPAEVASQGGEDLLVSAYLDRRASLVRFFAARAGSRMAAEDLAQELYLKLATRDPGVEAENPVALLYRIATNLMLDKARGDTRAAARDGAWSSVTRLTVRGQEVADEAPADEAVASRQRLRQLVAAVTELPPQMQKAFRLHKLQGLSHAQTAQVMAISVKSVEKHISAALKNLTARLGR
jgi:RNA polymerase sigma-70 factor (ECF subfamily)